MKPELKIKNPWSCEVALISSQLKTDGAIGISYSEVATRLEHVGPNTIETTPPPSWVEVLLRQFKSALVLLLLGAALISGFLGDWLDMAAIVLVLAINAVIGFVTEMQAISSMEALRKIGVSVAKVIREGVQQEVSANELVPGDILLLEAGDVVTADARLIESHNASFDESPLTGESAPVDKDARTTLQVDTILAERTNMISRGTHMTRGTAVAVITETGMNTELGKIARLASTAKEEVSPLEKNLEALGKKLVWLTMGITIVIIISGILTGKSFFIMLQTAIALAVATVPEGLPIVATIALAKGLWSMAKKNALINKLSAVETLGATSIIISDKTGTLTENRMSVVSLIADSEKAKEFSVTVLRSCNDAQLEPKPIGDSMEIALLEWVKKIKNSLPPKPNRVSEVPFDTDSKMMATFHSHDSKFFCAVKGAPESVIASCQFFLDETGQLQPFNGKEKQKWISTNDEQALKGLRLLGVAYKEVEATNESQSYSNLIFLGLVGLIDPARPEVPAAIRRCHSAGIKVIMATGDQAGTAQKIAEDIGLPKESLNPVTGAELPAEGAWPESLKSRLVGTTVLSRVSPEQKLRLVEFYQKQGFVVAMTGDGVNDAPALKKSDIGIAMGKRGTQVAREVSDMVLKDDHFETIVEAVQQGRVIFSNIRNFVIYLLSCNISEVFVVGLAAVASTHLPITPLQILFLNLVTDVFPALALGMGKGDSTYMAVPPRKSGDKILNKEHWEFIFFYGSLMTVSVFAVFGVSFYLLEYTLPLSVTLSFLTLGLSQVFHVFNLRKQKSNLFINDLTKNPHIWGAVGLCVALLFFSAQIPIFQKALNLVPISPLQWFCVLAIAFFPYLGQFFIRIK